MVEKRLVRTEESHIAEKENLALCMDLAGVRRESELSKHLIMRQVRVLHETVNDLVIELYGANPQHILFRDVPKEALSEIQTEIASRENRNNWGFGKLPRWKMHF